LSSGCKELIFLLTNMSSPYQSCRFYQRRLQSETFFSEQKSRGFHIHKSHLSNPARLAHTLVTACLAYIWTIRQASG